MHKILLTGASGFIGSNILNNFSNKNKFYLILRKKPNKKILKNKNIKIIKIKNHESLNDKLKKIKVDIVIHCATHYKKSHNFSDIKKFCYSNILLGNVILENLDNMKVKKFINFSTVWEDSDGIKDNSENLYAAYKKSFSNILNFYKKNLKKTDFYELIISDTFGKNDLRNKILNNIRKNYQKKRITKIISKNLYLNLLNISDIINAINFIFKKKITPKKYVLKNKIDIKIFELIRTFNNKNKNKIKVKWLSSNLIRKKIYPYDNLKGWKPKNSNVGDMINYIRY